MNNIIKSYLQKTNYSFLKKEFDEFYYSHPNYPSLFALTDSFNFLGIESVAAKIPKEQLNDLPNCFLTYVENDIKKNELVLVELINNKISIKFDKQKNRIVTIDEFNAIWSGIVVAIDPNEKKVVQPRSEKHYLYIVSFGLIVLFLIKQDFHFSIIEILSYLSYIVGFIVSIFIIQEKLDKSQESIARLCSYNENTSCDSVIKSAGAKINKWLDFSDLPILYFSFAILTSLIAISAFKLINILSLVSIPVIIYSLWLQKIKLKKWCVLCLVISSLLIFQTISLFFIEFREFYYNSVLRSGITSVFIVLTLWFLIKNYLEDNDKLEKNNKELNRFKRKYKIFELLQNPLKIGTSDGHFPTIIIGDPKNSIKIALVLSPSCGHCHTAFEQAINLFHANREKIVLSIFFNLNIENNDNPYIKVAKCLMQINKNNPKIVIDALIDWHINKMDLTVWLLKWEQKVIEGETEEILRLQYEWCTDNEFNYTPVKIINEKVYPNEYELEELKYFLSEIEETQPMNLV